MQKKLSLPVALGASVVALLSLSACSGISQGICGGDEYPVAQIGTAGTACQANGTDPAEGYTRYPEGKTPQKVGDKWDTYWQEHVLDANGNEAPAPAETKG